MASGVEPAVSSAGGPSSTLVSLLHPQLEEFTQTPKTFMDAGFPLVVGRIVLRYHFISVFLKGESYEGDISK